MSELLKIQVKTHGDIRSVTRLVAGVINLYMDATNLYPDYVNIPEQLFDRLKGELKCESGKVVFERVPVYPVNDDIKVGKSRIHEISVLSKIESLIHEYKKCTGKDPEVIRMSTTVFEMLKLESGKFIFPDADRVVRDHIHYGQVFGIDIEVYKCFPPEYVECGDARHIPGLA